MVVKDKVGRSRYIVFEVSPGGHTRSDMIRSINEASSDAGLRPSPRLTVFDGTKGIVKCNHREQGTVRGFLPRIRQVGGKAVEVRTIVSSGTVRKAKEYL